LAATSSERRRRATDSLSMVTGGEQRYDGYDQHFFGSDERRKK
jgi:hypothetical protein